MLTLLLSESQTTRKARPQKKQKAQGHSKRKNKCFIYACTQDLYNKNHSTLARYIREGVPWLENQGTTVQKLVIKHFYTDLWGINPDITLCFNPAPPVDEVASIQQGTINKREINGRINLLKKDSADDKTSGAGPRL